MARTNRGLNREFKVKFNPDFFEELETFAAHTGDDVSEVIRRAVAQQISGVDPAIPGEEMIGERALTVPVLGLTYGGPGSEIILNEKSTIGISTSMARTFGYQEGDVFLEVSGDSMAGAGVVDGSLVLMYDLMGMTPQRGRTELKRNFSRSTKNQLKATNGLIHNPQPQSQNRRIPKRQPAIHHRRYTQPHGSGRVRPLGHERPRGNRRGIGRRGSRAIPQHSRSVPARGCALRPIKTTRTPQKGTPNYEGALSFTRPG